MPALVLIYSSIDSISWVANDEENQQVGKRFQTWVNSWMLQKYPLPCTAEELYAARCGILHTLTPESDLSEKKNVRLISYAWGTAQQKDLEETIKRIEYPGLVAVHVNDILYSFMNGLADFINSLDIDHASRDSFIQKASKHFTNTEISVVDEFLTSSSKDGR